MQANTIASPLEGFKSRFEEIRQIKDRWLKNKRLEALKTDLENAYDIPKENSERITAFKRAYPGVMDMLDKAKAEMTV
ncbi:hypothetical protein [Gracilibacillus alcaliphilus]|uniref:hypothetical protein n=1 Tax=Gracilibacillus alcaliphilus TaxID=1401441 RepID=UPI00195CB51C|nr:hypothetical protein [Gracilibacillus alcaliphilus]MBM7679559.1 hypothetical protein [Gracilibacillus alcaliphilus]